MGKGFSSKSSGGSGVGLGVGAVAVNNCPVDNQTLFCQFSRIFQVISWFFTICLFAYLAYFILMPFFSKRRKFMS